MRWDVFFFFASAFVAALGDWGLYIGAIGMALSVIHGVIKIVPSRRRNMIAAIGMAVSAASFAGFCAAYLKPSLFSLAVPTNASLPLSITKLTVPDFYRQSGLYPNFGVAGKDGEEAAKHDLPMLVIRDVYISNTSLNRAVTLRFSLVVTDEKGKETRLNGEGKDGWGRIIGRDDYGTKLLQKSGIEPYRYLVSPLSIAPQTTVAGRFAFLVPWFGVNDELDNQTIQFFMRGDALASNKLPPPKFALEINDVITDTTIKISLPSDGYKGK